MVLPFLALLGKAFVAMGSAVVKGASTAGRGAVGVARSAQGAMGSTSQLLQNLNRLALQRMSKLAQPIRRAGALGAYGMSRMQALQNFLHKYDRQTGLLESLAKMVDTIFRLILLPIQILIFSLLFPILLPVLRGLALLITLILPHATKILQGAVAFANWISDLIAWIFTPSQEGEEPPWAKAFKAFFDVIWKLGEILLGKQTVGAIAELFKVDFSKVEEVTNSVRDQVVSALDKVKNFFSGLIDEIGRRGAVIQSALGNAFGGLSNFFSQIGASVQSVITNAFDGLKNFFEKQVAPALLGAGSTVYLAVRTAFENIRDFFEKTAKPALLNFGGMVYSAIATALTNIDSFFRKTALPAIESFGATIYNAINNFYKAVENGIKNLGTAIGTAITSVISNLSSYVINPIQNAIDSLFNAIKNAISGIRVSAPSVSYSGGGGGYSGGSTYSSGGGGGGGSTYSTGGGSRSSTGSTSSNPLQSGGGGKPASVVTTTPQPRSTGIVTISNAYTGGRPVSSAYAYQHGGTLFEPLLAIGLHSRHLYTLAESGPEKVVPVNKGREGVVINVTVNVSGSVIAERDLISKITNEVRNVLYRSYTS